MGLAVALACGACTSLNDRGSAGAPSAPAAPADGRWPWQDIALPAGIEPITAVDVGRRLVVAGARTRQAGTDAAEGSIRPTLTLLDGATVNDIPVRPAAGSPYAPLATWRQLAWDGSRLVGVGGAPGGAHANTRWTTWQGGLDAVSETAQSFYTFGGWGAGDLIGVAATTAGSVVVGAWEGAVSLDIALWTQDPRDGRRRWTRQRSAGTALASTATELAGVTSVTGTGPGLLLTGSVTTLGPGTVARSAAAWRTALGARDVTRIELPAEGVGDSSRAAADAQATGADCDATGCVVTGRVGARLAAWWVPTSGSATPIVDLPDVEVPDGTPVPAPALTADRVTIGIGASLLVRSSGRWQRIAAPADPVQEVHGGLGDVVVIAGRPGVSRRIYRAEVR